MELIMMNAICNSAAPTGLNIGWDANMTQGFRSASPHCTPAYTQTSPNGLLPLTQGFRSASPHCTPAYTLISPNGLQPNGQTTPGPKPRRGGQGIGRGKRSATPANNEQ